MTIDSIKEFRELTEIKIKSKGSGLLMIGGGVPKILFRIQLFVQSCLGKKWKCINMLFKLQLRTLEMERAVVQL